MNVQLHASYPSFQRNEEDPIACKVEKHKMAVRNAQMFVHVPLRSLLSPVNGKDVTEQEAREIAVLIDNDNAISNLRFALKLKEADIVGPAYIQDRAFAVVNKWRQSVNGACVSVLRDALHEVGLQTVDERVFGHIQDQTLTKPEARGAALSLPVSPESERKSSSTLGEETVFDCTAGTAWGT